MHDVKNDCKDTMHARADSEMCDERPRMQVNEVRSNPATLEILRGEGNLGVELYRQQRKNDVFTSMSA